MRSFWIVFMLAGSLGLASGAAADNDSDILRRIGMLGEWAVDCGLPPGPTNQHYVFGPTESGEVISLSRNGRREFAATFRNIRVISDTRVGWRSSGNESTTDVIVERNGSRFRDLQTVRIDGKILVKNGVMIEQGWGTPWLEKCSGPPTATISQQAMVDAWDDCKSVKDHDRAIRGCSDLIRVQPRGSFAYYSRAYAYEIAGERDKAIADVTEAIRLDPQYAEAYNTRAWWYFQTGNLVQGLVDIQRALELRPDDAASLDTRAHIYEAMNRRADAIVDYKHVLTLIPETHPNAQPTRDALKRLSAPTQ